MALTSLLVFLSLSVLCSSQSSDSSSVAGSTSSNAATVTVTSVSTIAIVILPASSTQSSTTPYSYSSMSSTSYVSSTLTSTPSLTTTTIALQTVPYTGQPLLVSLIQIIWGGKGGNSLTLSIRWAHVIFHNIRLYRSRMDPCLKYSWSVAPMIDRIAVLLCLSPMEPNQRQRMLCLYSTRLPLIYARKTSLTSIPCAVLRKLT